MGDTGRFAKHRRRMVNVGLTLALCVGLFPSIYGTIAHGHGYMTYPRSRAVDHLPGDPKGWPIAGVKAKFRREPCVGLAKNLVFTTVRPGPMRLKFLYPDGANHTGSCSAFLFDPLRPDIRTKIGEASDCARSDHRGAGEKGHDISGHMAVIIPENTPCDPSHCVLQWVWTATHRSVTNYERYEHYDNCADIEIRGARRASVQDSSRSAESVDSASLALAAIGQGHLLHLLALTGTDEGSGDEIAMNAMQDRLDALGFDRHVDADARARAQVENRKGTRQLREGRMSEALQSFHAAYRFDPVDAEIVNNLGYAYLRHGDPEAAEPLLLQALLFEPRRANAWANLGQSYAGQGKLDVAVASLSLAYRYSGDRETTHRFLTRLAGDQDDAASEAASRVLGLSLIVNDVR